MVKKERREFTEEELRRQSVKDVIVDMKLIDQIKQMASTRALPCVYLCESGCAMLGTQEDLMALTASLIARIVASTDMTLDDVMIVLSSVLHIHEGCDADCDD